MRTRPLELDYAQILETNGILQKWGEEAYWFLVMRTVQESKLFPVPPYILLSYANAFYRWPALLRKIEQRLSAEELGDRVRNMGGKPRGPALWALPAFYLLGREWFINMGFLRPQDAIEDLAYVVDFWKRFQLSFRRNQRVMMPLEAGRRAPVLPEHKTQVFHADLYECREGDELYEAAQSFMASMSQYAVLAGCESRPNLDNHGPYLLDGDRELFVREYMDLGENAFPWQDGIASEMPYNNLTLTQLLKGVHVSLVDEIGNFETRPDLQPRHTAGVGLYTSDMLSEGHVPVGMGSRGELIDALRDLAEKANRATTALWRRIASWSRDQLMDAGALFYFAIIKDFAHMAGCYDPDDWMVIDERADRFRPLLNDEYSRDVLGGLCVFTLPSHRVSSYRTMQHSELSHQPFTPIPLTVLRDRDYLATNPSDFAPGITHLDPKNDRYRTTRGVLSLGDYNRLTSGFTPAQCGEDYRYLCETWIRYNADGELANGLYRMEQSTSRNLRDRGAGLRREDVEALRK